MFTILNRFRGTHAIWAKINGIIISVLFYWFSSDIYTSISVGVLYVLGESLGWGKWIGGIMSHNTLSPTPRQLEDKEGRRNGIHFLSNLISPEKINYYRYCVVALGIRGLYWAGLTLLPLVIMDYITIFEYLIMVSILGAGFPLSVVLSNKAITASAGKKTHDYGIGVWEFAEVLYGLIQDIVLMFAIMAVLIS